MHRALKTITSPKRIPKRLQALLRKPALQYVRIKVSDQNGVYWVKGALGISKGNYFVNTSTSLQTVSRDKQVLAIKY